LDRRVGALGLAVGLTMATTLPALAQDPSASTGPWTVVAQGLDAPRGIGFGPDGTLYVGEQGSGGSACTETERGQACAGATGGISSLKDGVLTRVIDGLPSVAGGQDVGGVSDFAIAADGTFVVTVNLGGSPDIRSTMPEGMRAVVGTIASAAADGTLTPIADLAQWEADNDPDSADPGSAVDSNPYGLTITPDGDYLVTDAGGNDLLMVTPDGTISLAGLFPASFQPAPADPSASADPGASPAMVPMQAVPTAVVIGPDGAAYVSQLTGFPFPVGGASIWRVEAGKEPKVYATGLTNVMDLAFGPDGTLWVVEFAHNGLLSGDITGALLSIPAGGGAPTLVATEGLMAPGGVAVAADGTVYVANGSVMPGGGSVVSIKP